MRRTALIRIAIEPRFLEKCLFPTSSLRFTLLPHATEHREQIKSMLSALGIAPPSLDGWDYRETTNTLVPISK